MSLNKPHCLFQFLFSNGRSHISFSLLSEKYIFFKHLNTDKVLGAHLYCGGELGKKGRGRINGVEGGNSKVSTWSSNGGEAWRRWGWWDKRQDLQGKKSLRKANVKGEVSFLTYSALTCCGPVLWFRVRWAWGGQGENSAPRGADTGTLLTTFPAEAAFSIWCFENPAQPVIRELLLAHSWIWSGVFKQQLLRGYAEVQEKSVNTGKFICLLCDNWACFHMPNVWGRVRLRLQMVAGWELLFWGHRSWERLTVQSWFYACPITFPSAHVSKSSTVSSNLRKSLDIFVERPWYGAAIQTHKIHGLAQQNWGQAASYLSKKGKEKGKHLSILFCSV